MNQYQDNQILPGTYLKDRAKGALLGRFGKAVSAFFLAWVMHRGIYLAISFLFSFLFGVILITKELLSSDLSLNLLLDLMNDPSYLNAYQGWITLASILLTLGVSVFTGVFRMGLSLFTLNLACGRRVNVSDIFYGFHYQFRKSLALSAVFTLVEALYFIPANILRYLAGQKAPTEIQAIVLCLTVAGIALYLYLSLFISQSFFLLLDFPGRSAKELLRLSVQVMNGHKKRLFLLHVSFLPLMLLSVLSFGIGSLWITPYQTVTYAFFFLNLMQTRDQ